MNNMTQGLGVRYKVVRICSALCDFMPVYVHFPTSRQSMEADNATFERLALSLEMHTNSNDSKWELAAMTVSWRADLSGGLGDPNDLEKVIEQTDEIDVMPRRGYFSNAVQTVCTKVGNMTLGPNFMLICGLAFF